ncbi:heterokaryon incompatibility protein Het-C-domain-containing protein [Infundibulicybe gibba]|nr:heterokaryon incompatibility protein Het-C-domain-containing protein [Infundibulicybe gibba]
MPSNITIFLLLFFLFAFCLSGNGVYAFGAGNIPSFAYMEGRAFRHGDIEDALAELIKRASGGFALTSMLSKGPKFNGLDIKRVYFGNWLRDYSQAVDIASLKKVQLQTIMNLVMVLSFMAHGYATHEFEVTPERLGVYLPTEHIDNPKGYGEGEDPRKYHPNLRGPVDPRELEIDLRTGMKNYIANEQGHWDTSKALVRRTLERCIHLGRQHRARGMKQDEYEAYRLLGQSLHTLEDFSAHSNFCELALVSMGHTDVFVHVGDQVRIQAPGGKWVAPIVTGTFGSSDFTHSLLGEATDHLSEASVSDLNKELDKARSTSQANASRGGAGSGPNGPAELLREMFFAIPGGEGSEMSRELDSVQQIRAGAAQGGKRPEDMSPQELHAVLWQVLTFRDSVVKKISKTIEKIPGLGPLIDKLMDSISVFVFTTLEPFLKPLLKSATSGLQEVSGEVINTHDQYEVFNDPRASDPTHSFLSKDHFNLILNEPAGQLARMVLVHTVTWVIKAWDDTSVNVQAATEDILQCLFHPDFHNPSSKIQKDMLQCMHNWVQGLGNKQRSTLSRLTKNAVRNHENVRAKGEGGPAPAESSFAANQAHQFQHDLQGYASGIPVLGQAQAFLSGGDGKHSGKKDKKDDKKGDKKDDKKHDKKDDKKHDKKDDKNMIRRMIRNTIRRMTRNTATGNTPGTRPEVPLGRPRRTTAIPQLRRRCLPSLHTAAARRTRHHQARRPLLGGTLHHQAHLPGPSPLRTQGMHQRTGPRLRSRMLRPFPRQRGEISGPRIPRRAARVPRGRRERAARVPRCCAYVPRRAWVWVRGRGGVWCSGWVRRAASGAGVPWRATCISRCVRGVSTLRWTGAGTRTGWRVVS